MDALFENAVSFKRFEYDWLIAKSASVIKQINDYFILICSWAMKQIYSQINNHDFSDCARAIWFDNLFWNRMIVVCVQFSFNVLNDEFDDVFKLVNNVVDEIDINILCNVILSGFE